MKTAEEMIQKGIITEEQIPELLMEMSEEEAKSGRQIVLKKIMENIMVKYPAETGKMFAKLWILEEGEKAPNVFKTTATLFSNEVAIDFFTSVLPSLLHLSKEVSPLLK